MSFALDCMCDTAAAGDLASTVLWPCCQKKECRMANIIFLVLCSCYEPTNDACCMSFSYGRTHLAINIVLNTETCKKKNVICSMLPVGNTKLMWSKRCVARQFLLFQICCYLCTASESKPSHLKCVCIPQKVCAQSGGKKYVLFPSLSFPCLSCIRYFYEF